MAIKARLYYRLLTKKGIKKNKATDRFLKMIEKDTISNKKNHCHVYINIREGRLQDMYYYRCDGRHHMKIITVYGGSVTI